MKQKIFLLFISAFIALNANAQIKLGIATGISPSHIDPGEVIQNTPNNQYRISVTSATPPWMFGPFVRIQAKFLYLQTGLYAGLSKVYYDVDDMTTNQKLLNQTWDREYNFDLPIELGFRLANGLSFNAGVIGTNYLLTEKETFFPGFKTMMTDMVNDKRYGYKFGLRYDADHQVYFGVAYVNYKNISSAIVVKDIVDYNFSVKQHSILVTAYWNFVRE